MLFLRLGINQDVIDENHHELIQEIHEYLIHEIHEIGRSIGQSEGHHGVLKQHVTSDESCLRNVRLPYFQLVVNKVDLRKDTSST